MKIMTNFIWVTAQQEFVHKYSKAPRTVSFLRSEHRHNFHFKVYIEVTSNDREIEFILFQRYIKGLLSKTDFNLDTISCEMLSDMLHNSISERYPKREIKIEVSEDGENGVLMEYRR
jgi:hypothetical protein